MNLSRIFIERPVATAVLTAGLCLFGLFAFGTLPVNELPSVDFPTLQVTATLPGADPETMARVVATPLEREFSTISGIDSMSSVSSSSSNPYRFAIPARSRYRLGRPGRAGRDRERHAPASQRDRSTSVAQDQPRGQPCLNPRLDRRDPAPSRS